MTAIVYRDGIIAADTAVWIGNTICGHQRKIGHSADGRILLGAGGDPSAIEWFLANRNPDIVAGDVPKVSEQSFSAIVVYSLTEVVLIDERANRTRLQAPYFAIGRGSEFLFGALAAGATAEQAVMLVIQHTDSAAGEVHVERLPPVSVERPPLRLDDAREQGVVTLLWQGECAVCGKAAQLDATTEPTLIRALVDAGWRADASNGVLLCPDHVNGPTGDLETDVDRRWSIDFSRVNLP